MSRSGATLGINAITIAEIYSGLSPNDTTRAEELLSAFDQWVIEFYIARMAGELRYEYQRRGRTLSVPDTLIAAHAIARDAVLVTDNGRDFPMPELRILPVN